MDSFKEFQGRDLDAAIDEACTYFNTEREKLEVEIVQDAKTGIFGIVGARKAKVRARRAQLRETVESILGRNRTRTPDQDGSRTEAPAPARERTRKPRPQKRPVEATVEAAVEGAAANPVRECTAEDEAVITTSPASVQAEAQQVADTDNASPVAVQDAAAQPMSTGLAEELDVAAEGLPQTPLEELDVTRLKALTEDVVRQLVRPIVGEDISLEISVGNGRVQVQLDCAEDSGLLIGREGQTLAALRYLASRLVSRGMGAAVRIQLDAGEYRRRQDDKLREMALALAERVRQSGRSCSTRPLSSYHRRIVHVCLQEMPDVQTRSNGDGPLKRVVISRRRAERA